jgi:hypothetical protein
MEQAAPQEDLREKGAGRISEAEPSRLSLRFREENGRLARVHPFHAAKGFRHLSGNPLEGSVVGLGKEILRVRRNPAGGR